MPKDEPKMCQQPDRDVPGIVCGYPLPCPFHTVVVDATQAPALVDGADDLPRPVRRCLQEIGDAMAPEKKTKGWSGVPDADLDRAHRQLAGNFCELNDDGRRYLREIIAEKKRREGSRSTGYFDPEMIKACIMEKPAEDALWEYARQNRCPRCNSPSLQPLGELRADRGTIGILVCRECEYGVYVQGAAAVDETADKRIQELEQLVESRETDLAHFGECLEAVNGAEDFCDLVLRFMKERDLARKAVAFAACTIRSGESMTDEAEAIFDEALGGLRSESLNDTTQLGLLTDKPADLVVGARILARAMDRPVYLTKPTSAGGIVSYETWTLTIERDQRGSHVEIRPDGSAVACEVWT